MFDWLLLSIVLEERFYASMGFSVAPFSLELVH